MEVRLAREDGGWVMARRSEREGATPLVSLFSRICSVTIGNAEPAAALRLIASVPYQMKAGQSHTEQYAFLLQHISLPQCHAHMASRLPSFSASLVMACSCGLSHVCWLLHWLVFHARSIAGARDDKASVSGAC